MLGKPAPDFFQAALASIECNGKEAVMVGDDAEADVAGALAAGIGSALLVRTGKYHAGDENKVQPDPKQYRRGSRGGGQVDHGAPLLRKGRPIGRPFRASYMSHVYSAAAFPLTARKVFIESSIASSHGV